MSGLCKKLQRKGNLQSVPSRRCWRNGSQRMARALEDAQGPKICYKCTGMKHEAIAACVRLLSCRTLAGLAQITELQLGEVDCKPQTAKRQHTHTLASAYTQYRHTGHGDLCKLSIQDGIKSLCLPYILTRFTRLQHSSASCARTLSHPLGGREGGREREGARASEIEREREREREGGRERGRERESE